MSRPLRIEYPGALYHLTARGNSRNDYFSMMMTGTVFFVYLDRRSSSKGSSFREQMQRRIPHTGIAGIPGEQLRPDRPDCDAVLLNVANYFVCEIEDIISLPQRGIFSCCIPVAKRGEHVPDRGVELIWGFLLQNFPDSTNDSGWDVPI